MMMLVAFVIWLVLAILAWMFIYGASILNGDD